MREWDENKEDVDNDDFGEIAKEEVSIECFDDVSIWTNDEQFANAIIGQIVTLIVTLFDEFEQQRVVESRNWIMQEEIASGLWLWPPKNFF